MQTRMGRAVAADDALMSVLMPGHGSPFHLVSYLFHAQVACSLGSHRPRRAPLPACPLRHPRANVTEL